MRPTDLARLALDGLRRNRTRSLMTLGGIAVGVAALLALLSYGAGLQQLARTEFDTLALYNTLRVTSTPTPIAGFGDLAVRETDTAERVAEVNVTDSLLTQIEALPGVLAAYPEVAFPARLRYRQKEIDVGVEGVPMAFGALSSYRPAQGTFFKTAADTAALVSTSMVKRLGFASAEDAVGQQVTLVVPTLDFAEIQRSLMLFGLGLRALPIRSETHHVRIAGVLPEDGQMLSGFVRLLLPLDYAAALPKLAFFSSLDLILRDSNSDGYAAARVQLTDRDAYAQAKTSIEDLGVYVAGFREQFAQVERLFRVMDLSLAIVGLIGLLVATLGIANTMMMSVLERTGEIGVIKAVGGLRRDVRRLFLAESVVLGLVGGVAGVAVGYGFVRLLSAGVKRLLESQNVPPLEVFYTSPWLALGCVAVAVLVAVAAGLWPAARAARTEPLEALTYG